MVLSAIVLGAAAWLWWQAGLEGRRVALEIRTVPRGAEILVDGRVVGRSDLILRDLEEGTVEIVVRRAGYRDARRQVRLQAGEMPLASFALQPRPGTLRLRVEGPDEFLLASGDDSWKTPRTLSLDPGEHRFLLRAPGYRDRTVRARVEPGRETALAVTMERAPLPAGWPGAAGSVPPGLPAGAFPTGPFPTGSFPTGSLPTGPLPGGSAPGGYTLPQVTLPTMPQLPRTPPRIPRVSLPTPLPAEPPPAAAVTPVPPPTHPAPVFTPVPPPAPRGLAAPPPESLVTPVSH